MTTGVGRRVEDEDHLVYVLVIAEDYVKDQYVLQPLIEAMMKALDGPRAKVKVCRDPRFHGTSQALKWEFVQQALSRHEGMIDVSSQ